MIEYFIGGTNERGEDLPIEHGMSTQCLQHIMDAYIKNYPDAVHIMISVALDVTQLIVIKGK